MLKDLPEEILKDLDEEEAQAFLVLYRSCALSSGELSQFLNCSLERASEILESLVVKGFAVKIPTIIDLYVPLEPFLQLFKLRYEYLRKELSNLFETASTEKEEIFNDLSMKLGEISKAIVDLMQDFISQLRGRTEDSKEAISKHAGELISRIHSEIPKLTVSAGEYLDNMRVEMNGVPKSFLEEVSSKFTSESEEKFSIIIQEGGRAVQKAEDALKEKIEGKINQFALESEALVPKIVSMLKENASRIEQLETRLRSEIELSFVDIDANKGENFSKTEGSVQETMKSHQEEINKTLKNLFSSLKDSLYESTKLHDEKASQIEEKIQGKGDLEEVSIEKILALIRADFPQYIDRLRALKTGLDEAVRGIRVKKDQIKEISTHIVDLEKQIGTTTDSLLRLSSDLKNQVTRLLGDHKREQGVIINDTLKSVENLIEKLTNQSDESVLKTQKTIQKDIETLNELLSSSLNDLSAKIDEVIQSVLTHAGEVIKLQASEVESTIKNHIESSKDLENTILNDATTLWEEIANAHETTGKNVIETVKVTVNEQKENIELLQTKINETFEEIKASIDDKTAELVTSLARMSEEHKASASKLLDEYVERYEEMSKGELQKEFIDNITEGENAIYEKSEEALKVLEGIVNSASEFTEQTEKSLEKIIESALKVEVKEFEKTWTIVGKQTILQQILAIMQRTKSTVTILIPRLSEFQPQQIADICRSKPRIRVHIVGDVQSEADQEAAKTILSAGNVRVRLLTPSELYGAARDGEEVLLAPATGEEDMVGIVSTQEPFVKLYASYIGPAYVSVSRELRL